MSTSIGGISGNRTIGNLPYTAVLLLFLIFGTVPTAGAQASQGNTPATASGLPEAQARPADPPSFAEPIPLYRTGLGVYQRKISTRSDSAQAYFTQGMQLLFSFTPQDAARSFREAQKHDSACAMCYWGEALAWGPYLNGDMARDDAPRAFYAVGRAMRLAGLRTTAVERALIEALYTRYEQTHDAARREQLDTAYASAMQTVWRRHPRDLDAGTLYAEALMLLEPRRGNWDVNKPSVKLVHSILAGVLERDITHPGACHLYVHATESTVEPGKAEACAAHLGHSIPGASHMNHMPSHTYNRVGRWGDAVRANLTAWHSDQKAAIGEGFAIYPSHNLHMLLYSASYDGQGAVAIQAARDYAKLSRGGQYYIALTLFRFGRFDEILALTDAPAGNSIYRGLWDFARGYAHLRSSAPDSARFYLARVDSLAAAGGDAVQFRGHTARQLLGITAAILRAEVLRLDSRHDEAIRLLEGAVVLEDSLRYDEPEPLNFPVRQWLGAALLEAGRAPEAERVFRTELEDHPKNGWSLLGLEQALRAQNRDREAAAVLEAFRGSWVRADTWIRAARF